MSSRIWLSIFSGFSAFAIASLMLERISVDSFCQIPMVLSLESDGNELAQLGRVTGSGQDHALEGAAQLREVQVLQLERIGQHHIVRLDPIAPMEDVGRIQLQQPDRKSTRLNSSHSQI